MEKLTKDYIKNRITELRIQKGISELRMSEDLGLSRSYLQTISSGRNMPRMQQFLAICEYLGITPKEFFDNQRQYPFLVQETDEIIAQLPEDDISQILSLAKFLLEKDKKQKEKIKSNSEDCRTE